MGRPGQLNDQIQLDFPELKVRDGAERRMSHFQKGQIYKLQKYIVTNVLFDRAVVAERSRALHSNVILVTPRSRIRTPVHP